MATEVATGLGRGRHRFSSAIFCTAHSAVRCLNHRGKTVECCFCGTSPFEKGGSMWRESIRKLARQVRLRGVAALISAIVALVFIPSASAAYTEKYWWGLDITPNTSVYSNWHDWRQNKIWRVTGDWVQLWFDVNGAQYYWGHNADLNPFVRTAPSLIYSRGVCRAESTGAKTATCQIYDWVT
jgi:hypothetical protein